MHSLTEQEYKILLAVMDFSIDRGRHEKEIKALEKKGYITHIYFDSYDNEGSPEITNTGRLELNLYEKAHKT